MAGNVNVSATDHFTQKRILALVGGTTKEDVSSSFAFFAFLNPSLPAEVTWTSSPLIGPRQMSRRLEW